MDMGMLLALNWVLIAEIAIGVLISKIVYEILAVIVLAGMKGL